MSISKVKGRPALLFGVLLLALCVAGCAVTLVSDYNQQFDKQITEFEKEFNSFVVTVLLSKNAKEAAYDSEASQKFYYQTLPKQMGILVSQALVSSMQKPSIPVPVWGPAKKGECRSVVKLSDDQVSFSTPPSEAKTEADFKAIWAAQKRFVFSPLSVATLERCCPCVASGNLAVSLGNTNTTSICLLNYLWDNLALMAKAQWRKGQKGERLSLEAIQEVMDAIQTSFRMLSFFEQQKKRADELKVFN